jgi:hypothetical protein
LSDPAVAANQKFLFILRQKWFWGFITLLVILLSLPNYIITILLFKNMDSFVTPPSGWEAADPKPGLVNLTIPVERVIVTHTNDAMKSCTTQVCSHLSC